ncbi:MAG: hypothetical protein HEQ23_11155 [Tepidisphaera sp.]
MSVIYRAFKGLAAGAAALSAANAAAIDLAAFAGAGGDLTPEPACRCVTDEEKRACIRGAGWTEADGSDEDSAEIAEGAALEEIHWPVLALRSE